MDYSIGQYGQTINYSLLADRALKTGAGGAPAVFAKRIQRATKFRKAFLHFARAKIRGGARIVADGP